MFLIDGFITIRTIDYRSNLPQTSIWVECAALNFLVLFLLLFYPYFEVILFLLVVETGYNILVGIYLFLSNCYRGGINVRFEGEF